MPSLLENSPYAVAECIEHGIPFLAANVGGTPELVAEEDRAHVLHRPNAESFAGALERALASATGIESARPARAPEESLAAWLELIDTVASPSRPAATPATRVAVVAYGDETVARARTLAQHAQSVDVDVIPAESRRVGLDRATADWVLFLDEDDLPDEALLDTLVAAQAASGADAVTAAVRVAGGVQLFLGDPGPLGLVENQYGVIGLIRRSLATSDSDWLLFARLAIGGAEVVSVPEPLSGYFGRAQTSGEALAVLEAFETGKPEVLQELPQLTATLAAALARLQADGVVEQRRLPRGLRLVQLIRRARLR